MLPRSLPILGRLVNRLHPHTRGRLAEKVAFVYLLAQGYRPARRPGRAPVQTDLLLTRGTIVLLVEVKFRQSAAAAQVAVSAAQTRRLQAESRRLAAYFPHHTLRADILEVLPCWPWLVHRPGAIPLD